MTYHLKFTLLWMAVLQRQLQVFTEMIQRRLFVVFLRSTSQYYTCQIFLSQMREIFTLSWPRFLETSRRVPKISDEFPKTSDRCRKLNVRWLFPKTFEHFRSYLRRNFKRASIWFRLNRKRDSKSSCVLRTICPELWTRREKLSLMCGSMSFSPKA